MVIEITLDQYRRTMTSVSDQCPAMKVYIFKNMPEFRNEFWSGTE